MDRFVKGYFPSLSIGTRGSLGPLTAAARDRVESGRTASINDVVRAGLRALDREEALLDERLKARVAEALADPRPVSPPKRSAAALPPATRNGRPRRLTTKVRVVWRRTATDDLARLYDRIAARADPDTAFPCTSAIEAHRADLASCPHRGTPRDAIAPGVRTPSFRGRTVIPYRVEAVVEVLRIFHAGQGLGLADDWRCV